MKIDIAVFKLIDNDAKTIQKICVKVICNHKAEWDEADRLRQEYRTLSPEHKDWLIKSAEWKNSLHETVLNMMKEKYPHIKNFTLEKIEDRKECHKINISEGAPTNKLHMMMAYSTEKCMMKYCKGQKPQSKKEMFKYNFTFHEHTFEAKLGNNKDMNNIELVPLGSYTIVNNVNKTTDAQKGGYTDDEIDKEKYLKYKYKYNELKKSKKSKYEDW